MPKKLIRKTVKGENFFGRTLNKILPFPKARDAIGSAIKGTKQGLPVPEFEEANERERIDLARKRIENQEDIGSESLLNLIQQVYDILDDGRENDSRALSPKTRKIIKKLFSAVPIVAYLIYGITTGDFSLDELIRLFAGT